jgi:hypothetical protein
MSMTGASSDRRNSMSRNPSLALPFGLLAAAVLSGCIEGIPGDLEPRPSELRMGMAATPQMFSPPLLTDAAIHVTVPAGEWRILRLLELVTDRLYVASRPAPGARPYFGMGTGPQSGRVSFTAPPEDRTFATPAIGWFRGFGGEPESIIVLGSNSAATEFSIGYAPEDFDLTSVGVITPVTGAGGGGSAPTLAPEVAQALGEQMLARPGVPARFESGTGGDAGTLYQQRIISGELIEFRSGNIDFLSSSLASGTAGIQLLREYRISSRTVLQQNGVASFIALSLVHSGQVDFDFKVKMPPLSYRHIGGGAGVGGTVPAATAPLSLYRSELADITAGAIVDIVKYTPTEAGNATLDVQFRFSGREGTYLGPERTSAEDLVHALTPDIFWLDWGYISADLAALYGWQLRETSGLLD